MLAEKEAKLRAREITQQEALAKLVELKNMTKQSNKVGRKRSEKNNDTNFPITEATDVSGKNKLSRSKSADQSHTLKAEIEKKPKTTHGQGPIPPYKPTWVSNQDTAYLYEQAYNSDEENENIDIINLKKNDKAKNNRDGTGGLFVSRALKNENVIDQRFDLGEL